MSYASVDGLEITLDDAVLRADPRPAREAQRRRRHDHGGAGRRHRHRGSGRGRAGHRARRQRRPLLRRGRHRGSQRRRAAERPRAGSIQRRVRSTAHRLMPLVVQTQTPIVCRVQGWAAGIGFQLAAAADFTVAAADARFWEPFTERGFTPDSGATWLLPRLVGIVRARELLLLGRDLDGTEAAEWGLIHRAVPGAELDAAVDEVVGAAGLGADGRPRADQVAPGRGPDRDAGGPAPERGLRPRAVVAQRGLPRGHDGLRRQAAPRVPGGSR